MHGNGVRMKYAHEAMKSRKDWADNMTACSKRDKNYTTYCMQSP